MGNKQQAACKEAGAQRKNMTAFDRNVGIYCLWVWGTTTQSVS